MTSLRGLGGPGASVHCEVARDQLVHSFHPFLRKLVQARPHDPQFLICVMGTMMVPPSRSCDEDPTTNSYNEAGLHLPCSAGADPLAATVWKRPAWPPSGSES